MAEHPDVTIHYSACDAGDLPVSTPLVLIFIFPGRVQIEGLTQAGRRI